MERYNKADIKNDQIFIQDWLLRGVTSDKCPNYNWKKHTKIPCKGMLASSDGLANLQTHSIWNQLRLWTPEVLKLKPT